MNSLYLNLIKPNLDNDKNFLFEDDGSSITYKDFIAFASKVSHKLTKLGLNTGDIILVKSPKSKEALSVYLTSILTGTVYLPLNSSYKINETIYFIKDAHPSFFICEENDIDELKPICDEINCKILSLNKDGSGKLTESINTYSNYFEPIERNLNDLAALLYTSGTTGKPKGAMLSQENLVSNSKALSDLWEISNKDQLIHSLPIYHTHGLFVAINTSMIAGASIRFIKGFNLDLIIEAIPNSTLLMGVPTFYTRLLKDKRLTKSLSSNMRLFISGSAPLLEETHNQFENITGHKILERYGMTETNMNASNPLKGERKAGSVGKPLKGTSIRITSIGENNLSEINEPGMIEIKGPNVFNGYLNKPEKTKEAFTDDEYFITGDMGYFDKEGYLYISGRNKDLIISGGYNVYPKEIEDIVNQFDGIIESAVFGLFDDDLGEIPAVAIIANENNFNLDDLKKFIQENLARYKLPKKYFLISELPRNAMGKVQKNILKDRYS